MKKKCTWIIVMDSKKAFFLSKDKDGQLIDLDIKITDEAFTSNRGGGQNLRRVHDRIGPQRHISEPRKDEKNFHQQWFVKQVADRLDQALKKKQFDQLILVAPAKPLGILRKSLADQVKAVTTLEVEKDYVNHSLKDIQTKLEQITLF